jgi:hypothetical protein
MNLRVEFRTSSNRPKIEKAHSSEVDNTQEQAEFRSKGILNEN